MAYATLTSKGQITLPKSVRERLGVEAGDRIEFIESEQGLSRRLGPSRHPIPQGNRGPTHEAGDDRSHEPRH
ncbi:MAG: AbrB/MazE/SpoVT family DNA-binding domain-containing protein [Gammaproteobacteria bacterium]|nr:MAG: AbrB/MazE/SpoVT family DNA-binding domain-containing protein [Gammaproteobacteria bacterium]